MAITKNTLVDALVERYSLKRREALDLVDTFFDDIRNQLTRNGKVRLPGFGLFYRHEQDYTLKKRTIEDDPSENWNVIKFQAGPPLMKRIQRALIEESRDID